MNTKRPDGDDMGALLRKALADDLPPDVAAGMKNRIERFRERATRNRRLIAVPAVPFGKGAWAALSALVLTAGGLLQALSPRNFLADRVSAIGTSQSVAKRLSEAGAMLCTIRVMRSEEGPLDYAIEWRRDLGTTVTVKSADGRILETFGPEDPGRVTYPGLRDLAPFLDPAKLAELVSGGWRVAGFARQGGCDMGTYEAGRPGGTPAFEITVDQCSFLPVRIRSLEKAWVARLDFDPKGG